MYLYFSLTPEEQAKYWAVDIEGDALNTKIVWCLVAVNISNPTLRVRLTNYADILRWVTERLQEKCKFVGHNFIGYDAPTLNRLVKTRIFPSSVIDTLVLSQLYSPSLQGGHSLEEWGQRLRMPKGDFKDFSKYSEEMLKYCEQDVLITRRIYLELCTRLNAIRVPNRACDLEHKAWITLQRQKKNGFFFNIQKAHVLYAELREIERKLGEEIHNTWPPELKVVGTFKKPFKQNGELSANYLKHLENYEKVVIHPDGETYSCYAYVSFNVGSPPQRVAKLLELGWQPEEFTEKGTPKPTDSGQLSPSLAAFVEESQRKEPQLIAQWIEINSRANMVNTWIEAYNEATGCIHGSLWLANTLRYKHSSPNTANIPAVRLDKDKKILYGLAGSFTYEARDLWQTRDTSNRNMVGVDAKGIQLRILANYLNNEGFTSSCLSQDPHSANQALFGLPSRALTKTITYATLMGAGDLRVAREARVSLKEAKDTKKKFFDQIPEFKKLVDRLQREIAATGRITLCDGSKILVSKKHMAIPYLLQGDESKIMKYTMVLIEQRCLKENIDALQVGMIHDEYQFDVLKDHTDKFIQICLESFLEAGKLFNYNLPIEGDAKVGLTWAQTH